MKEINRAYLTRCPIDRILATFINNFLLYEVGRTSITNIAEFYSHHLYKFEFYKPSNLFNAFSSEFI